MKKDFWRLLLGWNKKKNTRTMPWKGEKNPYLIWLSEIILQQTRVEQGLPYFLKFKQKYPTVRHLAEAPQDEVLKLWQGLGYYSRARNLHYTARYIQQHFDGRFPDTYNEIIKLKGIGSYTAAAIASFAFGEKKAVVDGNVIRVLSRVFGINTAFDTTAGKKQFAELAQSLISEKHPAEYNQAIMDFGAMVCTPQKPICADCPFAQMCVALNTDRINELPVRQKKIKLKNRYFNYLLIKTSKDIYIQKRMESDIWHNLYELPLIETDKIASARSIRQKVTSLTGIKKFRLQHNEPDTIQLLSHQKIHFRFYEVVPAQNELLKLDSAEVISPSKLKQLAFPKTIHLFLVKNSLL